MHLSGTADFMSNLSTASLIDTACKSKGIEPGQYLTPDLLDAAAKVLLEKAPKQDP